MGKIVIGDNQNLLLESGTVIKAKAGDCCVFCSYGDINCPPIQKNSAV